ncbi:MULTISPECIES: F0F1 ATP synthase subunit B [unclassified Roseitalea]|uniref:F0F1 ATP synthase subunit B n=1 Tax=unclassified Roseitalea TaxID=2639107 RepID=UPI00273F397E|nr:MULTISPECIES: F0F1 ATP synthase subunit B [unclassified Roseitalea]
MDSSFWAFVGLIIFFAIIYYFKVPGMVTRALDSRGDRIRNELEEARRLREEAQQLLADYQRRRKESEKEAESIVAAARNEADQITAEAKARTEEYVARRTAMAEQKIAQAELDAVNAVRATAVDVAVAAAERLMGEKMTTKTTSDLFKASLEQVRTNMN